MIVADSSESIDGEPLFVKLVERGRVVYRESLQEQASRAERTWDRFTKWEPSAKVAEYLHRFQTMRKAEISAAKARLSTGGTA